MSHRDASEKARRDLAASVVTRLRESGFVAYWAGGCVRDLLLGLEPSDYDVATDARPEQVRRLFRRTIGVGASFGVVKVLGPEGAGDVEVATFRSDGEYVDGRRPESITYSTAESDAARRDFTINGMFFDPVEETIIDYVGGRDDLDRRVLRAIGDPAARFAEDKLRLLRAVRFAARFDLAIDPATWEAVRTMAPQIVVVSAERISQELRRMLVHPSRSRAMATAADVDLVAAVLPTLAALRSIAGPGGDNLWTHTLRVLGHLPPDPSFPLAFAALVHRAAEEEAEAREISLSLASSLKLSNAERDRIAWLVEHRRALIGPDRLPRHRLKRLLSSEGIAELLALHRAEAMARGGDTAHVAYCEDYLRRQPEGPIDPPPLLTGHDLARHGLRPGPQFARLLERVRDAQLDGLVSTRDEALHLVDSLWAGPGR